jgi:hypothetical protein
MKKIICAVLTCLISGSFQLASAQGWAWASKSSGSGIEQPFGIQTDASGNNYMTGTYMNAGATFGSTSLALIGSGDVFLTKTNSSGAFQWAVRAGSTMNDWGQSVAVNGTDVYITGTFRSTITFYSTTAATATLTGVTTDDECFIAKYNNAGVIQWAVQYAISGSNQNPRGIAINNTLSLVYVTGTSAGKLFTNCYNMSAGALQWSSLSTNSGGVSGWGIVSDGTASGNCYVVAQYSSGTNTIGTFTNSGTNAALLIKYDNTGTPQWVNNIGGATSADEFPRGGLGIDGSGNLYIGGDFTGSANISGTALSSAGGRDMFVAKYNSAGALQWAVKQGSTGSELAYGMATDNSGNTFLAVNNQENNSVTLDCQAFPAVLGNTDNKCLTVEFSTSGSVVLAGAPVSDNDQTTAWCITTGGSNTAVMAGLTIANTTFGATVFSSANGDGYLAKITSSVPTIAGATICSGSTAILTPSAPTGTGYTFSWYAAPTGGTPLYTGTSFTTPALTVTTTYYLTVNPGGCTSQRVPVTVTVNPRPTVSITGPTSICPAYVGTLTASGATTYAWMPGNATGSTLSVSPMVNTTYTVTGTNSYGCTGTATFTVASSPAVNAVSNGNFSVGPTSSVGSSLPIETGNCTGGRYEVGHTFHDKCTSWPTNIYDHTVGTSAGYFLMIDNDFNSTPQTVWSQKVSVTAGETYTFSFWSNMLYSPATHPVTIDMLIEGGTWGTAVAMGPTQEWRQYSCTYSAATTGLVMLNLTVEGTSTAWRDFGIDDIFFGHCADDAVTVNNISSGIPCTYTVTAIVNAVNASGSVTVLTSPAYAIAAGNSQVYTFSPPAGYWVDYSSLYFSTQTSTCNINNFAYAYAVAQGNCWDCSLIPGNNNVTIWEPMGGNVFDIHADLAVGRMANPTTLVTGTEDAAKKEVTTKHPSELEVFPNPSNGIFNLGFADESVKNVFVYDVMGNKVFEAENLAAASVAVDLSANANGIYFVKVVSGNEVITKRIIKQ